MDCDFNSFGYSGSSAQICSGPLRAQGRGSINICYRWFLEQTLSAPQRWEHCQWLFTQMTDVFPSPACSWPSRTLSNHNTSILHVISLNYDSNISIQTPDIFNQSSELRQAFWESFDVSAQYRTEWLSRGIRSVGCSHIWPLSLGTIMS